MNANRRAKLSGPLSNQSKFKKYYKLFQNELAMKFDESRYNMQVPPGARAVDGSVFDEYAKQFRSWNSVQLKCLIKGCDKITMTPYELQLHNQNVHQSSDDHFIKCTLCPTSTLFSFVQYIIHVVMEHFGVLRYR